MSLEDYLQPPNDSAAEVEYKLCTHSGERYPIEVMVYDDDFSNWVHKDNIEAYVCDIADLDFSDKIKMIHKLNRKFKKQNL